MQNRKILAEKIGTEKIAWMNQVHADKIEITDKAGKYSETDALITDQKNLTLIVMVADCVSVIYFDPENLVVAVSHAGREGTFLEIASKTFQILKLGIKEENIEVSDICTHGDENFFSYRREMKNGRFAGVVCLV